MTGGKNSRISVDVYFIFCPWAYCVGSSRNSLFVCLLSVCLFVVCPDQFWTNNPPKAPGGVPVRVQKQVRFGHFAESTRVSDGSNVPLAQFRDLPTQSVQGPPLPCGCNLVMFQNVCDETLAAMEFNRQTWPVLQMEVATPPLISGLPHYPRF